MLEIYSTEESREQARKVCEFQDKATNITENNSKSVYVILSANSKASSHSEIEVIKVIANSD